jgi:hypothetical protein
MIFLNAFSFGTPEIFVGQAQRDHQEARGPTARRLREVHRARKGLTGACHCHTSDLRDLTIPAKP